MTEPSMAWLSKILMPLSFFPALEITKAYSVNQPCALYNPLVLQCHKLILGQNFWASDICPLMHSVPNVFILSGDCHKFAAIYLMDKMVTLIPSMNFRPGLKFILPSPKPWRPKA